MATRGTRGEMPLVAVPTYQIQIFVDFTADVDILNRLVGRYISTVSIDQSPIVIPPAIIDQLTTVYVHVIFTRVIPMSRAHKDVVDGVSRLSLPSSIFSKHFLRFVTLFRRNSHLSNYEVYAGFLSRNSDRLPLYSRIFVSPPESYDTPESPINERVRRPRTVLRTARNARPI